MQNIFIWYIKYNDKSENKTSWVLTLIFNFEGFLTSFKN